MIAKTGIKSQDFEFITSNNYNINYQEIEPTASWLVKNNFRIVGSYNYKQSNNNFASDNTGQSAVINKFSLETNVNFVNKGLLKIAISNYDIKFTGNANTQVGYEMLQGLQPGNNQVWQVTLIQTISKDLQLNLGYDGRKSENYKAVHTGRIQARYIF